MMGEMVAHPTVLKIGAVILRRDDHAVLIVQPKPKTAGELPHFVLPRGSRQYHETTGGVTRWHDARDAVTGRTHAATLEPFRRGLEREIEEEAGVTPAQLARAGVVELRIMDFQSRAKGTYPIYWFLVMLDAAEAEAVGNASPVDVLQSRWATPEEIRVMASRREFSAGYLPVIEAALARAGGVA